MPRRFPCLSRLSHLLPVALALAAACHPVRAETARCTPPPVDVAASARAAMASGPAAPASAATLTVAPGPWLAHEGRHLRMEGGQLACFSEDCRHCSGRVPSVDDARSLRCDRLPRLGPGPTDAAYQGNGHRRPGHWCNEAYASLFAKWSDHTDAGHPLMLSVTPRGDVMCRSLDGVTCLPASTPVAPGTALRPVVCGRPMLKTLGMTGYEPAHEAHWCQSLEVVDLLTVGPGAGAGEGANANSDSSSSPSSSADGTLRVPLPGWSADQPQAWIVRVRNPGGAWRVWLDIEGDADSGARIGYAPSWDAAGIESRDAHHLSSDHLASAGGASTDDLSLAIARHADRLIAPPAAGVVPGDRPGVPASDGSSTLPAYYVAAHKPWAPRPAIDTLLEAHRLPLRSGSPLGTRESGLIATDSGPAPMLRIGQSSSVGRGKSKRTLVERPEPLGVVVLRRRPPPPPP